MRIIFIGDIHGCIDEFQELVEKVGVCADDRVICLGDFMDKGPAPAECVRFARLQGFESILGNHEERHIRWRDREERARLLPGYINKMRPMSPEDTAANNQLSHEDAQWLSSLPPIRLFQQVSSLRDAAAGIVAVHGGLFPRTRLEDQDLTKVLRARWVDQEGNHVSVDYDGDNPQPAGAVHWTAVYDGLHHVVYGHEAHSLRSPRIDYRNGVECYGIDTGCVHGGRLTAMLWEQNRCQGFVQVDARKVYEETRWPISS